jgi:ribokinase
MRYDDEGRRENERSSAESAPDIPIRPREIWRTFSPTARDARPCLDEVDCMHLAPMPVESQNELLALAAGKVPLITLDIPWFPGRTRRGELPEVGLASAVLLSEAEIAGHYPGSSAEDAAADLMGRGAGIVGVKQGGRGSVVFSRDRPGGVRLPVFQTRVVDPTGAGDSYCGGFGVGLWQRGDPISAGLYGTVAASFVIEGFGADYALRYGASEAQRRLEILRTKIGVPETATPPGQS